MSGVRFVEGGSAGGINEQLAAWRAGFPRMGVLALVAEADRREIVPRLQDHCSRLSIPLNGAVFPAVVAGGAFHEHGCVLLRLAAMPFARIYDTLAAAHPDRAGTARRIAADVTQALGRPRAGSLFLLFDAMVGNIASVLEELYLSLADRVRYFGANAGSETFAPMPCLFDNHRETGDGVLALLMPDHPGAVVEHCYRPPERVIAATSTEGNRIISIDGRPAFEVYRESVEAEYGVRIDRESFYRLAVSFPFGIVRASDEVVVRIPVALQDDGSVFCVGEVPPNALLTLLRAADVDSARTVERLTGWLETLYGSPAQRDVLMFYCAGRRIHLGARAREELAEVRIRARAAQVTGALSLGEVGHSLQWGNPTFHNGALVCCCWED